MVPTLAEENAVKIRELAARVRNLERVNIDFLANLSHWEEERARLEERAAEAYEKGLADAAALVGMEVQFPVDNPYRSK